MEFDGSLNELGDVDSKPLSEAVLAMSDEAWQQQQYRQKAYSVHEHTESLVLVFCQGWPELQITKEPAWDPLHEVAVPLMHQIIADHYPPGGTIIRAMAAKLKAGGSYPLTATPTFLSSTATGYTSRFQPIKACAL